MTSYVVQNQTKSGKIRSGSLSPKLGSLLQSVGQELGVYFDVESGGQSGAHTKDTYKKSGGWTGSHRHDDGNAADVKAYTVNPDGSKRYLDFTKPDDQAIWGNIVKLSVAAGATGVGAGEGYMGGQTVHIGFGKPATWGDGQSSANTPDWLRTAYADGQHLPPGSVPQVGTALDTIDRVFPRPMPSKIASAYADQTPPLPRPRPALQSLGAAGGDRSSTALSNTTTLGWDPQYGHTTAGETVRGTQAPADYARARLTASNVPAATDPRLMTLGQPADASGRSLVALGNAGGAANGNGLAALGLPGSISATGAAGNATTGAGAASLTAQAAPVPMNRPVTAAVAPTPMPGRPADTQVAELTPQQAQPAPQTPRVKLASGDMIAPGVYPSNDGNHSVKIEDDGKGGAKITRILNPGEIPGVIDPLREVNSPTIAGNVIRSILPKAVGEGVSAFQASAPMAANNVKNTALDAVSALDKGTDSIEPVRQAKDALGSAFTGLTGFLGGLRNVPQVASGVTANGNVGLGPRASGSATLHALGPPVNVSGSPDERATARVTAPTRPVARQVVAPIVPPSPVRVTTPVAAPKAAAPSGNSGKASAPAATVTGSATGRSYVVGKTYSDPGTGKLYVATPDGFKKAA